MDKIGPGRYYFQILIPSRCLREKRDNNIILEENMIMEPLMRVYLYDDDHNRFFGEGPCRLLHAIEATGSLRAAAGSMGMAYSKALSILKRAENTLQFPLTEKYIGGKGGGGSRLTAQGKEFLAQYETYRDACYQENIRIYHEIFRD